MKRRITFTLVLTLIVTGLIASCGGNKKKDIVVEPMDTMPADTMPVMVVDTTPEPPPKPILQETQFETVYFDLDKFNLRSDTRAALDANFALLSEFPDVMIKIEGHCDERGTIEYNLSLGEKRARAVKDYLVGIGANENRISIISYGKERPVDNRQNEEAWAKNRRCEFRIVSQ